MRSYRAQHNLVAVSANTAETAINTEATLDTTMRVDANTVINLEPRRESNADELTGTEEPTAVYDLGNIINGVQLSFTRAQPQHFALLMSYAMSGIAVAAAGDGYTHTFTPIANDVDADRSNESFTLAQRFGSTILKRRFASMFVDSFTARFPVDDWLSISGTLKGTGKVLDNITNETVAALDTATTLTLAAAAVEGATAAARLDSVHRIRVPLAAGTWTEVTYTAVSDATPAVITIVAPGVAAESKNYEVLYVPDEAAWCTFPAEVTETPMRISQVTLTWGGTWDGSDFNGGREMDAEIRGVEWTFNNNGAVEFVPGAGDSYASRYFRSGRTQTVRFNREMRDYILQQHIDDNDTFGLEILAEGAVFDSPHKYTVHIVFPLLSVVKAPISVDGKRIAEAGDLLPLEDSTYGSVIAIVKNMQETYAAE